MHLRQLLMLSTIAAGIGGGGSTTSSILSLTVVGATPLLDQSSTTDFGDSTARVGVNGDGWVAKVVVPLQGSSTFDPTKISLTLSDPGYSAPSVTTTRTRTVRGGRVMRRQYTAGGAQSSPMSSNDGTNLTIWFSLIADNGEFATVYSGTTITAGSAATNFYGPAAAGTIASLTNSSTRPYYKPGFAWLNRQHEACGSGGQYVEAVAMHKHAAGGQQVAGIEFIATDAHANTAATQTVTTPILSTLCTKGQPPGVYAATIPVTALTQADLCVVNAKVYPLLGDSSAVLNVAVDGFNATGTYTSANPQTTLRFLNDKTGGFGNTHASVKAGVTGGTVSTTESGSRATPYPSVRAALFGIQAANAAKASPNTHTGYDGGHIWLMDNGSGSAVAHDLGADANINDATSNNLALTEIRQSPANTATASIVVQNTQVFVPWGLSWHVDILIPATIGNNMSGGLLNGNILSYYCDGTFTQNSSGIPNYLQHCGIRNLTHAGSAIVPIDAGGSNTTRIEVAHWIGYICPSAGDANCRVRVVLGGRYEHVQLSEFDPTTATAMDSQDGKIIINNLFLKHSANASRIGDVVDTSRGCFIGQNVFEQGVGTGAQLLSIADETSNATLDNVVVTANSIVGNRFNLLYTDTSTKIKRATTRFNLIDERNNKNDLFTVNATTTGRTGSWAFTNGVDCWDGVLDGDSNGVPGSLAPVLTGAWIGEYWANPSMADLTRAGVTFTSDLSAHGANTGGGTYSLTGSSNTAYNGVPTGFAPFKYDIAGVLRKNDGTGAVGAYERTV